jgi:hypothetical protein
MTTGGFISVKCRCVTAVTYGLSAHCDTWIVGPRSPIPRTPIQRPSLAPGSPPEPSLFGEQMAGAALTAQIPNRRYFAAGLHYPRTQAQAPVRDPPENGPGLLPSGLDSLRCRSY